MVDHNLLQRKKLFLFDLDGTLYLGDRLFEGVASCSLPSAHAASSTAF